MRIALSLVMLFSLGCVGLQQGKTIFLKPSAVSPKFKDLDDENPLAKGANKVEVQKVGIKNYDAFFQETAEVEGTVVLADVVLKETDAFIAKTKKEIAGGKVLTPKQVQQLNQKKARVDEITKLVGAVPERSEKLMGQGEGLSKNAPKQFTGPDAVKLPGVIKGLDLSMKSLRDAATRSPKVLDHAAKTSASLAELG